MTTDSRVMFVAGVREVIVARHERVEVFDFEGRMVEAGLAHANAQERVVVGVFVASIAAQEARHDVVFVAEKDIVRRHEAESRPVPLGTLPKVADPERRRDRGA